MTGTVHLLEVNTPSATESHGNIYGIPPAESLLLKAKANKN